MKTAALSPVCKHGCRSETVFHFFGNASRRTRELAVPILGPPGTARRLVLAMSAVAIGFATTAAKSQNLVDIRVPDFRAADIRVPVVEVRAPDVRVPVVVVPDAAMPRLALPAAPNLGSGLVFYGNYCGPGSRGAGLRPIDALDAACARHDACTPPPGALASCGCNARLQRVATAVAMSPRTPEDTRAAAQFIAEGAKLLACR